MTKIKTIVIKTWVFVVAVLLILGSSSVMALTLNNSMLENTSESTVITEPVAELNVPDSPVDMEAVPEYKVMNLSNYSEEQKAKMKEELKLIPDITPEDIEAKYDHIISSAVPGDNAMSAEQAAAYAADILKKAYNADLNGYTAKATFNKYDSIPNSDNWRIIFDKSSGEIPFRLYDVCIHAVTGIMQYASFGDIPGELPMNDNKDYSDPSLPDKAKQALSGFLKDNVIIDNVRTIGVFPHVGVRVLCELSDGSAYVVEISGEKEEAQYIYFFPRGYDGSMEVKKGKVIKK